ncbi:MAG: protein kinase [Gaiellaceae bacterium]
MTTSLADPLVGTRLEGRYRIEARIARGGMATVYRGLDERLDRVVAIKVMHPGLAEEADFLARFTREARAAARLSSGNVVSVFDQGCHDGLVFLVMELVTGRTLRDVLAERGRLSPAQALSVLEPVLLALAAAHRAGLVHRDVKPENVLLGDDGSVKVADFGLARAVEASGGRTVRGRSLPYRESSAYGGFASQLKQLCGIFESDPVETGLEKLRARVSTLLDGSEAGDVAEHLAILVGLDEQGAVADRATLFFSVRSFIEAVARERPTLLVFEDLHWADGGLLDLVQLLGSHLRDLPILVLALARPELLDLAPGWGSGMPAYSALPLEPLGADDARELATRLLDKLSAGERGQRAERIAETGEGNPLFLEQLAATMAEAADQAMPLPSGVRGIVAARLDALPPAERAILLDAAVVGKVFWLGALEQMTEDPARLPELLAAVELRDLVRRERVSAIEGDQQFTFKHVLIRDVAYDLLPRTQRRERHAGVARYLEQATSETGEAAAALARHWRDAGEELRAIDYFVAAAAQAERGWAKEQAAALYRDALDLVPAEDEERRGDLRRRLALAHSAAYHVRDARLLGLGPEETD